MYTESVVMHEGPHQTFRSSKLNSQRGLQDRLVYCAFDLLWRYGDGNSPSSAKAGAAGPLG
jgi:hypothetical protein